MAIADIVSLLADGATAIGLPIIVHQVLVAGRQRRKESSQSVWDLLAAEDVYLARMHVQAHPAPADYATVMVTDPAWIAAATRCFLAYQKASQLVLDHKWMEVRTFAEQWGFSTLLLWARLEPWILWYREAHAYPGFGRSFETMVREVRRYEREPGFRQKHFTAPAFAAQPPVQVHRVVAAPGDEG